MNWLLGIGIGIDLIATLFAFYTLFFQLTSRNAHNNNSLLAILTLIGFGIIGVSLSLKKKGYSVVATVIAWLPAIPALLYGLLILAFLILKPDFK